MELMYFIPILKLLSWKLSPLNSKHFYAVYSGYFIFQFTNQLQRVCWWHHMGTYSVWIFSLTLSESWNNICNWNDKILEDPWVNDHHLLLIWLPNAAGLRDFLFTWWCNQNLLLKWKTLCGKTKRTKILRKYFLLMYINSAISPWSIKNNFKKNYTLITTIMIVGFVVNVIAHHYLSHHAVSRLLTRGLKFQ